MLIGVIAGMPFTEKKLLGRSGFDFALRPSTEYASPRRLALNLYWPPIPSRKLLSHSLPSERRRVCVPTSRKMLSKLALSFQRPPQASGSLIQLRLATGITIGCVESPSPGTSG